MIISILTLFPESITPYLNASILKKAQEKNLVKYSVVNIRDFAKDKHKKADDHPYGGGIGMIMKVDIVVDAIEEEKQKYTTTHPKKNVILLDPRGLVLTQEVARKMSVSLDHLILVCGHYEGIDERIYEYIDQTISIGDYVLTGGELPALIVADAVTRLLPGVLDEKASKDESFEKNDGKTQLSYPQYTRPEEYRGSKVPSVLVSGNHKEIEKWKAEESLKITKTHRPDLLGSK